MVVVPGRRLRDADADDELLGNRVDRRKDLRGELHAGLGTAAVLVVASVRVRREELVEQVAVRAVEFHAVEPRVDGVLRRGDEESRSRRARPALQRRTRAALLSYSDFGSVTNEGTRKPRNAVP